MRKNLTATSSGFSVRVRVGKNDRPTFAVNVTTPAAATEREVLLRRIVKRLRRVLSRNELVELLRAAGDAKTTAAVQEVEEAVEAIATGKTVSVDAALAPTFQDFAREWTSGELRKKHQDHVREKNASNDVQILRDYVNPEIGKVRLPDVKLAHAERVMSKLPGHLAPRTRKKIAQCVRKVLAYAVYPGRHIGANPIPVEWIPKIPKSANKAKSCLYPDEEAKLVSCSSVLLVRRLAYGILTREGLRAEELELLQWRDVDLERGSLRLDKNKSFDPRAWSLSPDVVRTLAWWKKRNGGEPTDYVIGMDLHQGAKWLKGKPAITRTYHKADVGDLRRAGVTRAELFERTPTRQPIRLHDLRATFVTISLANGKSETWVSDRTGHRSSQMISTYTRQARTWEELALGGLRALDSLLPEMQPTAAPAATSTAAITSEWTESGQLIAPPARVELAANALGKRCSIH